MLVWSYMAVVLQEIMKTPICQTEFYLYLHFQIIISEEERNSPHLSELVLVLHHVRSFKDIMEMTQ